MKLTNESSSAKINVILGDTVNLLCGAKGQRPIKFTWKKDNRQLQSYIETSKPYRSAVLSVKITNTTNYGKYICFIQNQFSNISHEIMLVSLPTGKISMMAMVVIQSKNYDGGNVMIELIVKLLSIPAVVEG